MVVDGQLDNSAMLDNGGSLEVAATGGVVSSTGNGAIEADAAAAGIAVLNSVNNGIIVNAGTLDVAASGGSASKSSGGTATTEFEAYGIIVDGAVQNSGVIQNDGTITVSGTGGSATHLGGTAKAGGYAFGVLVGSLESDAVFFNASAGAIEVAASGGYAQGQVASTSVGAFGVQIDSGYIANAALTSLGTITATAEGGESRGWESADALAYAVGIDTFGVDPLNDFASEDPVMWNSSLLLGGEITVSATGGYATNSFPMSAGAARTDHGPVPMDNGGAFVAASAAAVGAFTGFAIGGTIDSSADISVSVEGGTAEAVHDGYMVPTGPYGTMTAEATAYASGILGLGIGGYQTQIPYGYAPAGASFVNTGAINVSALGGTATVSGMSGVMPRESSYFGAGGVAFASAQASGITMEIIAGEFLNTGEIVVSATGGTADVMPSPGFVFLGEPAFYSTGGGFAHADAMAVGINGELIGDAGYFDQMTPLTDMPVQGTASFTNEGDITVSAQGGDARVIEASGLIFPSAPYFVSGSTASAVAEASGMTFFDISAEFVNSGDITVSATGGNATIVSGGGNMYPVGQGITGGPVAHADALAFGISFDILAEDHYGYYSASTPIESGEGGASFTNDGNITVLAQGGDALFVVEGWDISPMSRGTDDIFSPGLGTANAGALGIFAFEVSGDFVNTGDITVSATGGTAAMVHGTPGNSIGEMLYEYEYENEYEYEMELIPSGQARATAIGIFVDRLTTSLINEGDITVMAEGGFGTEAEAVAAGIFVNDVAYDYGSGNGSMNGNFGNVGIYNSGTISVGASSQDGHEASAYGIFAGTADHVAIFNTGVIDVPTGNAVHITALAGENGCTHYCETSYRTAQPYFEGPEGATGQITNSGVMIGEGTVENPTIFAETDGGAEITNLAGGLIQGATGSTDEVIVLALGAPVTIYNAGDMIGRVLLTEDSVFDNVSMNSWDTSDESDFGGGASVLNNSGAINVFGDAQFVGLPQFNNFAADDPNATGVINMQATPGFGTLSTDGDYDGGNGSRLLIDAYLDTVANGGDADNFMIAGAAEGQTLVQVNNRNPGPAQYDPVGVLVAGADTGVAAAFQLDGGAIDAGFFDYDIYFDPRSIEWYLRNAPNQRANEMPMLAFAAQEFWHGSTGVWLDRTADLRAAGGSGSSDGFASRGAYAGAASAAGAGVWARAFGSRYEFDFGVEIDTPTGPVAMTNELRQRDFGVQAGIDFDLGDAVSDGQLYAGVLLGYGSSNIRFADTGSTAELTGWSIGAYATYINGGFFIDGLIKGDLLDASFSQTFDNNIAETRLRSLGFTIDTGYRVEQGDFFIEPMGSLAYVTSRFDDFQVLGNDVEIGNNESLRGRLGVRVGTTIETDGGRIDPYLSANLWHEFMGRNSATIGAQQVTMTQDMGGTWGEIGVGANFFSNSSSLSGFASASMRFGNGTKGGRVQVGLRHSW